MVILRRLDPRWLLVFLGLALALRALVPAGFMPVADSEGLRVEICSGSGPMVIEIDPGRRDSQPPRDPCPYGLAMGAALDVPPLPVLADAPAYAEPVWPGLSPARLVAARSLRPPARGPPAFA